LCFLREGCRRLVLLDLNEAGLHETKVEGLKVNNAAEIAVLACDVSDEAAVNSAIDLAVTTFGRIDYAVNCAGLPGGFATTTECTTNDFDQVQKVNVRGTWLCMKGQLQQMKSQSPLESKK
jgi:NAD(P)-dependent dehydrogenase (short-subunit alcohol dehydrogenase family)